MARPGGSPEGSNGSTLTYLWMDQVTIYRNEGIAGGLFKGLALTWLKAITLTPPIRCASITTLPGLLLCAAGELC